jgi:hypothetical protein
MSHMRIEHVIRRLPTVLPFRPRLKILPLDRNGWLDQEDQAPCRSDHSPAEPPMENGEDRYVRTWREHIPHTGRRPPQKGVANFRGSTTDAAGREIVHESTMERATSTIALADRRIARLQSQVGPVDHLDGDGKAKHPVFDFLAEDETGRTLAIAVKPKRKRLSSGIDETIAMVRQQRPDFGDEVRVWTEEQLPRYAEHNAGLILRSRKLRNDDDVAELKHLTGKLVGVVHIGHLVRHAKCGRARAFAAIVNLIDDGALVAVSRGRIRPELTVRLAGGRS